MSRPRLLYASAVLLGVLWLYVQLASRYYVDRFKPRCHAACKAHGLTFPRHPIFSNRALSSTDLALVAPLAISVVWVVLAFDAFRAP